MARRNTKDVNYTEYLRLDRILDAQFPESANFGEPAHDETLFIITHQAYELWFKQVLHELRSVQCLFHTDTLDDRDLSTVVRRVERVVAILKLLVEQLGVLETMTPLDFLDFRDLLLPASGFQSIQFKELEITLGLKSCQRIAYDRQSFCTRLSQSERDHLACLENQPSLFELVQHWLERMPFLEFGPFKFWQAYSDAVDRMLASDREIISGNSALSEEQTQTQLDGLGKTRALFDSLLHAEQFQPLLDEGFFRMSRHAVLSALFIHLYRDEPMLHLPFRVLNGLAAIDEQLTTWRQRHAMMVHRMLGGKIGTGGSSGHEYLSATATQNRVFRDLFHLTTFLIPRSELPELPDALRKELGFRFRPRSV
ncbi:MAG: tryptophan 2,3-dioxygenase family protein [Planctomycetota bacterium]